MSRSKKKKRTLGQNMFALRERAGLRSTYVANQVGISPHVLRMFEEDERELRFFEVEKIAAVIGATIAEAFEGLEYDEHGKKRFVSQWDDSSKPRTDDCKPSTT